MVKQIVIPPDLCDAILERCHDSPEKNDFVGPFILFRIDTFTKYAEVIAVRDCTAETAALEFVNKIVNRYGTCKESLSDRGAAFESDLFRDICKLCSIKKLSKTSYRPTCNSIVERGNLNAAVAAYNIAVHSALGESSHYMFFGYN
ncbi:K02A2.6-like [Cordylochernes scorpioides]|uniref:K02A2.6-like n=1 Tax=Cordylochernes scorpioides TaxID=51811 RepID=A0ABY6KPB5_9ARAC|nr:K02A2.6-like [Cordylochernes scorpioides]